MLSGSRRQLALAVLTTALVLAAPGAAFSLAAEPGQGLRDLLLPVKLAQPGLAPQLPSPETEADTAPEGAPALAPVTEGAGAGSEAKETLPIDPSPPSDDLGSSLVPTGAAEGDAVEQLVTDGLPFGATDVPAPVYSSGSWFRGGRWYTQIDFVMMDQRRLSRGTVPNTTRFIFAGGSGFKKGVLAYDTFSGTSLTRWGRSIGVDSLFMRFEPGTRLTMGRLLGRDASNRDHAIEFTFLGLFDWTAKAELAGVGASFNQPAASIRTVLGGVVTDVNGRPTAIFVPGFSDADAQQFRYDSDFNSYELNFRLQGRPDRDIVALQPDGNWIRHDTSGRLFSLLGGIRFVAINDTFHLGSHSAERRDNDGNLIAPEISGLYNVDTYNNMVGLQFGFDILEKYTQWGWGVRGRAAGFTNFAGRTSQIDTLNGIDPRSQTIEDVNFASLMEMGVFLTCQVRPNTAFRAAYDIMYVPSGTADVQRNLSLQPTFPALNLTGRRLYQGVTVGLEMVW